MEKNVELSRTLETADKRPLPGTNINDVLRFLSGILSNIPVSVLNKAMPSKQYKIEDVMDELTWVAKRWDALEHGLMPIVQDLNAIEASEVLLARQEVLYWLFSDTKPQPSNEEIIALCKGSNNPKFTQTITFQIPHGYKGGAAVKLMYEAARAIEIYERNYGPYIPEPEYIITRTEDEGVRRFVNPAWIDWWNNYSERRAHPEHEIERRIMDSYKDRPELTNLDVRIRKLNEPISIDGIEVTKEVFVSYQAFL